MTQTAVEYRSCNYCGKIYPVDEMKEEWSIIRVAVGDDGDGEDEPSFDGWECKECEAKAPKYEQSLDESDPFAIE